MAFGALGAPVHSADFDYYLLAISWHPEWCGTADTARGAVECGPDADLGFTLHGLWPQYEDGWPEDCDTQARDPSRSETSAMADIMGSGGLAWYQWRKHGRCSGLDPRDYFAAARETFASISLPQLAEIGQATAAEIKGALIAMNPGLRAEGAIVTCRAGQLREIRVCLTPDLAPRSCSRDVLDDACRADGPIGIAEIP